MRETTYSTVDVAGGLIPHDVLSRIGAADRDLPGIRPEDYHLAASERLGDAASRKWDYLLGAYRAFHDRVPEDEPATALTRDRWSLILLSELGFGQIPYVRGGMRAGDKEFPVSHLWQHVPVHLVGWNVRLDRATPGVTKRAPQSMVQEFLNLSDDHLWGVLSNGRRLRILRDSTALIGSAYVEFDLEAMFAGELYAEFVLLYTLLHASRFELPVRQDGSSPTPADCWLERWRAYAAETGMQAREQMRFGVQRALEELGTGFLVANPLLRDQLESGDLDPDEFHHELLRLAYQLIFVFVAEDRAALLLPEAPQEAKDRYTTYFSTRRLRRLAAKRTGDRHTDLWKTLVKVIAALGDDDGLPALALPGLGGLFFRTSPTVGPLSADPHPDQLLACDLPNDRLLAAIRNMSTVRGKDGRPREVDFQHLGTAELGSVYESLLELVPDPDLAEPKFALLDKVAGNDRKTTGSYYTPSSLIESLLDTTLDPVIDRYVSTGEDLLKITVCDPACGSGHFLVAAARRIAKRLAALRTGEDEPVPKAVRESMREVVARCVYGVDVNPLAAELAKVSLWIESLDPGRPLAFLDAHIKVGNSLLGVTPALLTSGIPDDAFKPIEGDDRKVASSLKKQNARERGGQETLIDETGVRVGNKDLAGRARALAAVPVSSVADVREQERRFLAMEEAAERKRLVADAWCAAFVWRKHADAPAAITTQMVRRLADGGTLPKAVAGELREIVKRYRFFHWHLEFPEVFEEASDGGADSAAGWRGGFACVLGNPPWERVKLQEQEFFAARAPEIAGAKNAAQRKKMIAALAESAESRERALWADYQDELRVASGWSHVLRTSGRYPLTGRGDINTYAVFAETGRIILAAEGRVGMVLPTGIATDATTQYFFKDLVTSRTLVAIYDFENEDKMFPQVHNQFRFCLWSAAGARAQQKRISLAFRLRRVVQVEERSFTLAPEDITLLNPNTGTCPVFDYRRNAEITLKIYRRVPVLWQESPERNSWGLSFVRMLDMANDSNSFHERLSVERAGWRLEGNVFADGPRRMLPLYEAKMVHHFDHRFGTYDGQTEAQANKGTLPRSTPEQKDDPGYVVQPRYWVEQAEIDRRLDAKGWDKNWLMGWRDISNSWNERTVISSIIPRVGVGHTFPLALTSSAAILALYVNFCSLVFDFAARQKISSTHLTYSLIMQLPVLLPQTYDGNSAWAEGGLGEWINARAIELSYNSYEMEAFARDHGDEGPPYRWDEERRFWLRAELDAAYFHLYGIEREDVNYIMDSFRAFQNNAPERFVRTKKAILEIYELMGDAIAGGKPYQTMLNPPPGQGPRHQPRS
ncbi:Eco57I restriction-modification methylase domain-containing protein [Nonomuraea typhae]|uniref:Eco57I restriction-modification methylase domain-containing protein n=1 Tax=Nonomuraea typhae TaxID=2603600 RepID=UPI0012F9C3E4|nr:DNA methyltransferase [Nonomuraea typhae]